MSRFFRLPIAPAVSECLRLAAQKFISRTGTYSGGVFSVCLALNYCFAHADNGCSIDQVQDVQNNTYVNTISVGPFMVYAVNLFFVQIVDQYMIRLSAYLFEATNNTMYQQTAQLSLDFMINHLWNGTIVYDGIDLIACQPTPKPFTLNQAWFVEGDSFCALPLPVLLTI